MLELLRGYVYSFWGAAFWVCPIFMVYITNTQTDTEIIRDTLALNLPLWFISIGFKWWDFDKKSQTK